MDKGSKHHFIFHFCDHVPIVHAGSQITAMKTLVVLVVVAVAVVAAYPHKEHHKKDKHDKQKPTPTPLVKRVLYGNDELAFYEFEGLSFLVAGEQTEFIVVNNNGSCVVIKADEDEGAVYPPINQTICDEIANTVCEPATANFTCRGPEIHTKNGDLSHETGNGYHHHGPLCHLEVGNKKMQPSGESFFLFIIENKIQACFFEVAQAPTQPPKP